MIIEGLWIVGLVAIYAIWSFGIKPLEVAKTRGQLFELRNLLFSMGCDNKIEFSSDAYRITEEYLNAIIRNSHKITFLRILILWPIVRKHSWALDSAETLKKTIDNYPNRTVSIKLTTIRILGEFIIIRQMCMSFLPTWVIFMILSKLLSVMQKESQKKQIVIRFKKPVQIIEADAMLATF